ncbi:MULTISPECIES: N-acetyltransferase [unclassified Beijerinckia]|uniref:GNAT family N-acetyltransferase n=1 Tax=unclassified Beijerinckia TaxID=2638183 RepID=UPI00089D87AF|nr:MULTISPECIES: N-acetyltransferase [unclassified Beijerinckia]MDH7797812.1 putative acetyltransferase [Beijerinckia sp. GAS462]SEC99396.1 putative acetyltransferase [Beijerinckia sp. 28-YEA-48]
MLIRDEQPDDIAAIHHVVEAAFGQAVEAALVDQLRAAGDSVISLVAIEEEAVVGHVMFSRMTAPFKALGLAPVAVLPQWQGRGIGSALIREGLKRAAAEAWPEAWSEPWQAVFVLGDPAYYRRFGFDVARASGFISPYAGPYLMLLTLRDDVLAREGRIDYAPAFAALG